MIDFDALVIGPAMNIFARPITVLPLASQAGQPAYGARGIWSSKPVDVAMEDGIMSSQEHTLSVRASEFTIAIKPGDKVTVPGIGIFLVEDTDDDGQGGTELSLKAVNS
jgi:hypothetical protein